MDYRKTVLLDAYSYIAAGPGVKPAYELASLGGGPQLLEWFVMLGFGIYIDQKMIVMAKHMPLHYMDIVESKMLRRLYSHSGIIRSIRTTRGQQTHYGEAS